MNREHLEAVGKAFGMTVTGLGVGWMASRMYSVPGTPLRRFLLNDVAVLFEVPWGSPPELMLSTFLGFLVVTLMFFTADWRKTVPGILFGVFLAVMTMTLGEFGFWLANVSLSVSNGIAGLTGGILAFAIQYRDLKRQQSAEGQTAYEFNRAIIILPLIFGGMVIAVWVQTITSPAVETYLFVDTVSSVGFLWLMLGLIKYNQRVLVLPFGIGESGKTVSWYEMYRALVRTYTGDIAPSDKMREFDRNMTVFSQGDSLEDAIPGTSGYDRIDFSVPIGDLFPLRIHLALPDMEGEWAPALAGILEGWSRRTRIRAAFVNTKALFMRELSRADQQLRVAYWLRQAEAVTLFIDVKRIKHNETTGGEYLKVVATELNKCNVHLIPVAAKADTVADELFARPEMFAGSVDGGFIRNPDEEEFDTLADNIESWLRENDRTVQSLLDLCDEKQVYPIGIRMTTNSQGEEVPALDENDREQTFGFEQLANRIIEVVEARVRL